MRHVVAGSLGLLVCAAALAGCTIAKYELHSELSSSGKTRSPCEVRFHVHLLDERPGTTRDDRLQEQRAQYGEKTREVLSSLGCDAREVASEDANLSIRVVRRAHAGGGANEYLSALSLGLIPSWVTEEAIFRYTFADRASARSHEYTVDSFRANHIVLIFVGWTIFFTLDEMKVYGDAVQNFMTGGSNAPSSVSGNGSDSTSLGSTPMFATR